jgi:multiple sugar transport system substrate-binding protein
MKLERSSAKRMGFWLLALFLVLAITGVAWLQERTLKIAIHEGVEGVALKKVIAAFADTHRYSVEVFTLPYDRLYDFELEELKKPRSEYDVIMLDDPWLAALISEGDEKPLRLEPIVQKCEHLKEFVPSTLSVCRHPYKPGPVNCGDPLYALPFVGNSQLFAIRKVANTQHPPITWENVVKISREEKLGYVMRVGPGNSIVTDFMPMLWGVSPESFKEAEPPQLMNAMAALQYVADLGRNDPANLAIVSIDDFDLAIRLARSKASMSILWSAWAMAMANLPGPYSFKDDLQFVDMPGGNPVLGAWLLAIPSNSRRKIAAKEFLTFATEASQIRAAAHAGNPPPLTAVLKDEELRRKFPSFPAQLASLEKARPRPRTRYWRDIEATMGDCLSGVYESTITVEQASERIARVIDATLKGHKTKGFTCSVDLPDQPPQ